MWTRARHLFGRESVSYLEQMDAQDAPNYGIWLEAPKSTTRPLAQAAPHILAQDKRRDTALWPALFKIFPSWHWGMQPTGDCTRWMQQHLLDCLMSVQAVAGKQRAPEAQVAGESIYALAKCELANSFRYHGAGCTGEAVAKAVVQYGSLYRKLYSQTSNQCDLRKETNLSVSWGNEGKGLPNWLEPLAAEHKAADAALLHSVEEMGLLIQAGYACQWCGMTSWGRKRDADGIAVQFDHGAHAITATGVRWNQDGTVLAIWIANTGHGDHVTGPVGPIPVPEVYAECGSWVPASKIKPVVDAGDCHVTTAVAGWPILDLPSWGTEKFL